MTPPLIHVADPKLDLVLERIVDLSPELVFAAWTTPEHIKHWFTPAPWRTTECEIDLRPGGKFRTVMEGPAGERNDNTGCILEVVPNRKFAWTGALLPGYRPYSHEAAAKFPFLFSAVISIEPHGQGTKYTALVIHSEEEGAKAHSDMGFHVGWGIALDQLVAHMRTIH